MCHDLILVWKPQACSLVAEYWVQDKIYDFDLFPSVKYALKMLYNMQCYGAIKPTKTLCRIFASMNWDAIGSDNGCVACCVSDVSWVKADMIEIGPVSWCCASQSSDKLWCI